MAVIRLGSSCIRLSPSTASAPKLSTSPSLPTWHHSSVKKAARIVPSAVYTFKGVSVNPKSKFLPVSITSNSRAVPFAANDTSGHEFDEFDGLNLSANDTSGRESDEFDGLNLSQLSVKLLKSVIRFPWHDVYLNLKDAIQRVFVAICNYFFIPLLLLAFISDISYYSIGGMIILAPISSLLGWFFAGRINNIIINGLNTPKDCEVPWHLLGMTVFFVLLKPRGPYDRNGVPVCLSLFTITGLLRTLLNINWSIIQSKKKIMEEKKITEEKEEEQDES